MVKQTQYAKIDGKQIKLSNLEKVLYPELGITKAEVIQYYLLVAPYMLSHMRNRAMTFIRYPDGVLGHSFYQKDRPNNTPKWIKSLVMGEETKKEYILIDAHADIVWLATMACLEMHQMQSRSHQPLFPDHVVFDLDPSPEVSFDDVKHVCILLKRFLDSMGYNTFVKTSGGKGFHIFIPIIPDTHATTVKEKSKELASQFIKANPAIATLQLPKNKRTDKTLIDIYRNSLYSTIVAPYSLRGKPGAPVSMPISWDTFTDVKSAQDFTILNSIELLKKNGDIWRDFEAMATHIIPKQKMYPVDMDVPNEKLASYYAKRDFSKTPEPVALQKVSRSNRFVIHRHMASQLHYDLRLEDEGVIKCWALPKGLPFIKNEKRLAIQTEDHPISYLKFKGTIPQGQYGAGEMDIYESGTFKWLKKKEGSYTFSLKGKHYNGTFLIYQTKEDQWIIERKDTKAANEFLVPYTHMLAEQLNDVPIGGEWQYEVKWDGIRAFLKISQGDVIIKSRSLRDITHLFPEVVEAAAKLKCNTAVLDGEIVVLDGAGRPIFKDVISRMHTKGIKKIKALSIQKPVVFCVFDITFLDGKEIIHTPLHMRQKWVNNVVHKPGTIRPSEVVHDGHALYNAAKQMGLEGIMAKKIDSTYQPNSRSKDWVKIKFRYSTECIILGYTKGTGHRSNHFGSLHLGEMVEEKLVYRGRVGTGFNADDLNQILNILQHQKCIKKPFSFPIQEENKTTWIEPILTCKIEYASITENDTFREPVFKSILEH